VFQNYIIQRGITTYILLTIKENNQDTINKILSFGQANQSCRKTLSFFPRVHKSDDNALRSDTVNIQTFPVQPITSNLNIPGTKDQKEGKSFCIGKH
jgi:hypothetical protein